MRIQLSREALLKPLQAVIGVVERKQTLPILSNVLVNFNGSKMSIMGTDLEVELVSCAALDVNANYSPITLPGRKLIDICRSLPEGAPIELYQDKEKVVLHSGRSRFTLQTLPASDFPNVETQTANIKFDISQQDLKRLLQRTYFSMAHEDVRYYLNGLLLECSSEGVKAVATDGHRLALNSYTLPLSVEQKTSVIIPRKGVMELVRMLESNDSVARIAIGSNFIKVSTADFDFTSKLIDGRFPDYDRVIPKAKGHNIVVNKELLKQALARTAILCNEKFKGVRLEFHHNLLRALSNNPEQEAAEEELVIDYNGPEFYIGFNVVYLMDVLNTSDSKDINLFFVDSSSSVVIEESSGSLDSTFVVMPMRL